MKSLLRFTLVGLGVIVIAGLATWVMTDPSVLSMADRSRVASSGQDRSRVTDSSLAGQGGDQVPLYSVTFVNDSGFDLATSFMPTDYDRSSLEAHRKALQERSSRARAQFLGKLSLIAEDTSPLSQLGAIRARLEMLVGLTHMHDGAFPEATSWFERAREHGSGLPPGFQANLLALLGMASLRQGEVDNCVACVGPSSCIFPIDPEARHQFPTGSRAASRHFLDYLQKRPEDQGVRWLLNIAAMTLGEYPSGVPAEHRISLDRFQSQVPMPRFANTTVEVGLDVNGANMAGGSAFDDFNGDGLPDIFFSSCDWDTGASLFINLGNGRFQEWEPAKPSLKSQDMSLNLQQADFDNDGNLDVLILRGGWEGPGRMSLLRNLGRGTFEDVTIRAGLHEPIASQAAAWGDYDNDGKLDLFVGGEYHKSSPDPKNLCRLYHNNGDGTFTNIAQSAGVLNEEWTKAGTWGDYDDDGKIDLYVSNMNGPNRLYRNRGGGIFEDVARKLKVDDPFQSFACWFWDYDNDGKLDLFVCGYFATLNDIVKDSLGESAEGERPRLYRNVGDGRFQDVTAQVGLDFVTLPMGTNYADIDNDGFLDMYLGTGQPAYMTLVPNLMFKNEGGKRFVDITAATGTGHLQKGHGVSFADGDGDGSLDLFVQMGGVATGDRSHNVYFHNPGPLTKRHWLDVQLVGVQTNRSAFGAKIHAELKSSNGAKRAIYRVVGAGSSFGGNSLTAHLGLDQETEVESLTITWPVSGATQVFHHIPADQTIQITEGESTFRRLERPAPNREKTASLDPGR